MGDKQECMFCNGHGVVEEWSESLNDWKDETCQECGGTGFQYHMKPYVIRRLIALALAIFWLAVGGAIAYYICS